MPLTIQATGSPGLHAVAFAQATVTNAVVGFTIPEGVHPKRAWLTVHTNAIRYRYDGADPDPTTGHLLSSGGTFELIGARAIETFRMCRDGTNSAAIAYSLEV